VRKHQPKRNCKTVSPQTVEQTPKKPKTSQHEIVDMIQKLPPSSGNRGTRFGGLTAEEVVLLLAAKIKPNSKESQLRLLTGAQCKLKPSMEDDDDESDTEQVGEVKDVLLSGFQKFAGLTSSAKSKGRPSDTSRTAMHTLGAVVALGVDETVEEEGYTGEGVADAFNDKLCRVAEYLRLTQNVVNGGRGAAEKMLKDKAPFVQTHSLTPNNAIAEGKEKLKEEFLNYLMTHIFRSIRTWGRAMLIGVRNTTNTNCRTERRSLSGRRWAATYSPGDREEAKL
jgi:hypothetical protein